MQIALGTLIQENDYWKRVWITQEVVLSNRLVICLDKDSCSWEQLCAVLKLRTLTIDQISGSKAHILWLQLNRFEALVRMCQDHKKGKRLSLWECLLATRHQHASDDHDHIYGILGLTETPSLAIDYGRPLCAFYRDIFRYLIEHERSLDALSVGFSTREPACFDLRTQKHSKYLHLTHDRRQQLKKSNIITEPHEFGLEEIASNGLSSCIPSWLPFWTSCDYAGEAEVLLFNEGNNYYRATADSKPEVRFEGDIFVVRGVRLSSVVSTTDLLESDLSEPLRHYYAYEGHDGLAPDQAPWKYPYGRFFDGKFQAYIATLIQGHDGTGRKSETMENMLWSDVFTKSIEWSPGLDSSLVTQKICEKAPVEDGSKYLKVDFQRAARRLRFELSKSRTFFFISSGHMGVGSTLVRTGDVVCLLLGARVPFILRPYPDQPHTSDDEMHFHLIGECCELCISLNILPLVTIDQISMEPWKESCSKNV